MYANNRWGTAPKAVFRAAGGVMYTFAHPFITDQIAQETRLNSVYDFGNEVDVTACLRLNDTFFSAQPAQDNAIQEAMVDGSTITITNHLMNGRATLQVIPGTGLVKDGDLTAIAPFVVSNKDNVGGILTRRIFTSAGVLTRVFYGVSFASFPHAVDTGNALPVYPIVMLYGGWIEGIANTGMGADRMLWAVGNQHGLRGNFTPFTITGIGKISVAGQSDEQAVQIDTLQNVDVNTLGAANTASNADGGYGELVGGGGFTDDWNNGV